MYVVSEGSCHGKLRQSQYHYKHLLCLFYKRRLVCFLDWNEACAHAHVRRGLGFKMANAAIPMLATFMTALVVGAKFLISLHSPYATKKGQMSVTASPVLCVK